MDMPDGDMTKWGHDNVGHDKVGHDKGGHARWGHDNVGHDKVGHDRVGVGTCQKHLPVSLMTLKINWKYYSVVHETC